jgi:hypothetical protein
MSLQSDFRALWQLLERRFLPRGVSGPDLTAEILLGAGVVGTLLGVLVLVDETRPCPLPRRRLVQPQGSGVVCVVDDLCHVRCLSSPSAVSACNYATSTIVQVPPQTIAGVPQGAPVDGPPCPPAPVNAG